MDTHRNSRNRLQRGISALIVVSAVSLGACSAGSDDDATDVGNASTTTVGESDSEPSNGNETAGAVVEATSLLPMDADAPAGYTMVTARCDATDAAAESDDAPSADVHRSGIVFAVPETWSAMGSGSGGSGSVMGTDGDVEFDLESGEGVTVGYEWDARTMDGEVADSSGQPWTTFDYEVSTADESTMVTYDEVATVTIEDQDVDLYYRDPSQAPDDLSMAQYKARINVLEMPRSQMETDVAMVYSVVVTIEFDPAESTVTQDVIETIVGSYSMPSCTWDDLLEEQELLLQTDLNGDGEVTSAADMQAELEETLNDLEQQQSQDSDG